MGGTIEGNRKIRDKMLARDPDHYRKIGGLGKRGGKYSPGSFTSETAREAGKKSKRGKSKKNTR